MRLFGGKKVRFAAMFSHEGSSQRSGLCPFEAHYYEFITSLNVPDGRVRWYTDWDSRQLGFKYKRGDAVAMEAIVNEGAYPTLQNVTVLEGPKYMIREAKKIGLIPVEFRGRNLLIDKQQEEQLLRSGAEFSYISEGRHGHISFKTVGWNK